MVKILYMKRFPKLFSFSDLQETYKTASAFSVYVYRAMKRNDIKQVKRGLYALVNPTTGMIFATKFQIASRLFDDAFFSYHEALEYYGLANQSFVSEFTYLTKYHARDLEFEDVIYKAKKSNCNLFIEDRIEEEGIRVVSLERAIIDSIDYISLSGGLEEVEYALENCPKLNIQHVEQLLKTYNKKTLYQKVGYLFEKHFGNAIPEEFYQNCLEHSGSAIVYLECNVGEGKLNAKWKLVIKGERIATDEVF